jgi:serine/threonine protein kinase
MDLTYTSVGGGGVGCVNLYGISTVPASALDAQPSTSAADSLERTVVLVTQYATHGSIRDYLKTKLPQTTYTGSWELIIDMLSSIANGLHTLHRHNVIHRFV